MYPFHYEVRFRFLSYTEENKIEIYTRTKEFSHENPLKAREDAFKEFNEYLSYKSKEWLKKNSRGNYIITQPSRISEVSENNKQSGYSEWRLTFEQYKEDISVFLVLTDEKLAEKLFYQIGNEYEWGKKIDKLNIALGIGVETEFEIHKVASYSFEEQDIIDNLNLNEFELYKYFNIDIGKLKRTVYHFGLDYSETGENTEDGAKREILETPHIWQTIEEYREFKKNNKIEPKEEILTQNIDYLKIIERGEGHYIEFKPSLVYNFNTNKGGISVLYIIAKTICSFLNSDGGILFIGVTDSGEIQSLKYDYSLFPIKPKDKVLLQVDTLLVNYFGIATTPFINSFIENIDGKDILVIEIEPSSYPVFVINKKQDGSIEKDFFVRMNASTHQLSDVEEIIKYIFNKKWANRPERN